MEPDDLWDMFWTLLMLTLIGVFLFCVNPHHAEANEPTKDQIEQTYALAYGLVAYKMKLPRLGEFPPPEIHMSDNKALCAMFHREPGCPIRGVTSGKRIYLDSAEHWESPAIMTIVLHEYVHYFQNVKLGETAEVCESIRREEQAYRVQWEVLNKLPPEYEWAVRSVQRVLQMYRVAALQSDCSNQGEK